MRKISVSSLKPGMKVARRVYDSNGFVLLNRGVRLENEYIRQLKKLNIPFIYVIDHLIPDVEIEDVVLDETRQKASSLIKSVLMEADRSSKEKKKLVLPHRDFIQTLDQIIQQLLSNKNLVINLADIRSADDYTFAHSVNVAVLSIMTAIAMGCGRSDLQDIGLGAFLHDLGKIMIPISILNKNARLLPEEYDEIKKHPYYGYDMLKNEFMSNGTSGIIAYEHHERVDGSGYPNGLKSEDIHQFSKIVAVADVYDALVSDRPYRKAFQPHQVLEIFESQSGGFDSTCLQLFFRHVAAYPVGTIVGLNTGLIGVVVFNQVGFTTRPRVRIIGTKEYDTVSAYEIDLKDKLDIVVDRVYEDEELPEHFCKRDISS